MDKSSVEIVGMYMERHVPIDLFGLARDLGLTVVAEKLSDDVSGKIECPFGRPCKITINSLHSAVRQRFTLAHEIAHFVLHRDIIGDGIVDNGLYRSMQPGNIERQANQYAADILMPWRKVREDVCNGYTANDLATRYGVSIAVAEIRLKELNLN